MPLPRKGILIRLVIYGSLLGYFGWQALSHFLAERAAEESAASADEVTKREYKLPDGRSVEVLELTPEQAERMYGVPPSVGPGDAAAPGDAAKPGDAAPEPAGEAPAPEGSAQAAPATGGAAEAAPEG
ncbi:MAG: hypothetical protein R3A79_01315 [Nannocystaceae bacterium]